MVVGCGGTGGFLAEAICRLLMDVPADLYLVDMDRVEPHNCGRQAFGRGDVGRFKSEVLAERFSHAFGREVGYSVLPYDADFHAAAFGARARLNLIVGCVDNAAARRAIASTLKHRHYGVSPVWWLDCGNGRNAGQVLLGNVVRPHDLRGAFVHERGVCRALPAPSLQRPDLLAAPPEPRRPARGVRAVPVAGVARVAADCAQRVARSEQGPTINQMVAAVAAGYVEKLLSGTCRWMASYFDSDDGLLRCVPADPRTVAELAGLHLNAVAPVAHRAARFGAGWRAA